MADDDVLQLQAGHQTFAPVPAPPTLGRLAAHQLGDAGGLADGASKLYAWTVIEDPSGGTDLEVDDEAPELINVLAAGEYAVSAQLSAYPSAGAGAIGGSGYLFTLNFGSSPRWFRMPAMGEADVVIGCTGHLGPGDTISAGAVVNVTSGTWTLQGGFLSQIIVERVR